MNINRHAPLARTDVVDLRGLLRNAQAGAGISYGMAGDIRQSYIELADAAEKIAASLYNSGITQGDKVIIIFGEPQAFLEGFWGCLIAGACPVPIGAGSTADAFSKLLKIASVLKTSWLLSDTPLHAELGPHSETLGMHDTFVALQDRYIDVKGFTTESVALNALNALAKLQIDPDTPAFIQFSSGSTGDPKGVVLTHRRILAHLADLAASCEATEQDIFLSWFPLTHDMGMVLMHLVPLMLGAEQGQIPTKSFVQRPRKWLTCAARLGATVICTNNFGLKHFLKVTAGKDGPTDDLGTVRLMFNAAEPISNTLWEDFMTFVGQTGLQRGAMYPGYGLAEATLAVTVPVPGDGMRTWDVDRGALGLGDTICAPSSKAEAVTLVDVGRPIQNTTLRIATLSATDLGEGVVGEVQLKSHSAAQSYFHVEHTATLFTEDGWLRTGDLGVLKDGRLFITGRIKEVIIQGGQNLYPHDLEQIAEEVPGVDLGKVILTSVFNSEMQSEQLLLFLHTRRVDAELVATARAVRRKFAATGGWHVDTIVPIFSVPKTSSGKIRRSFLGQSYLEGAFDTEISQLASIKAEAARSHVKLAGHRRARLGQVLATLQNCVVSVLSKGTKLNIKAPLVDQGLNSARAMVFVTEASAELGMEISITALYDYPTLEKLAEALIDGLVEANENVDVTQQPPVAVIGVGCRLPGGIETPEDFDSFLRARKCAVGPLPDSRAPVGLAPSARPVAGFIEDVAGFDAEFFAISWAEAEAMDPQQRMLLMVCHEALERAGLTGSAMRSNRVGTFIGIGNVDYAAAMRAAPQDRYSITGVSPSIGAGRIAYALGLTGPAIAVDTACSSSLVALHLAVQGLIVGDCDTAIVAGVNQILSPDGHAALTQMSALSPTKQCRAFDEQADGYVRAEGCGAVVLRLATYAEQAGDHILAHIAGTAVNQDGRSGGLTVPSGPAQKRLICRALARAKLRPQDVDYVEAHGTGTPLGDPIELNALGSVYAGNRDGIGPLRIGSVKTNLGHLEAAAGMAGLIKTIISLQRETLYASLNCTAPSTRVDWERQQLSVVRETLEWARTDRPRVAGVSAFGFAGTNAHVIVKEPPQAQSITTSEEPALRLAPVLALSAATKKGLRVLAQRWATYLRETETCDIAALSATSVQTRGDSVVRAAGSVTTRDDALEMLDAVAQDIPGQHFNDRARTDRLAQIGFVFTGQGSQWGGMGADLLETAPAFTRQIDEIDALLETIAGWRVRDVLTAPDCTEQLQRTDRAQVAIFAIQVGLCRVLEEVSIFPDAVTGHSVGEVASHYIAGTLTLEDAVNLVAQRGTLMLAATGRGRMLAVEISQIEALERIEGTELDLAVVNGPNAVVLSGSSADIARMVEKLKADDLRCRDLGVDYAFHGRHVQNEADQLGAALSDNSFQNPIMPLYSTVTGLLSEPADQSAAYWCRNMAETVNFEAAIMAMHKAGCTDFIEIGPHPTLGSAISQCLESDSSVGIHSTLIRNCKGALTLSSLLAGLHVRGVKVDWSVLAPARVVMPDLPTYPWQLRPFWREGWAPWDVLLEDAPGAEGTLFVVTEDQISLPGAALSQPPLLVVHTESNRILAQHLADNTSQPCILYDIDAATSLDTLENVRCVFITGARNTTVEHDLYQTARMVKFASSGTFHSVWALTFEGETCEGTEALLRVAAREHPTLLLRQIRLETEDDLDGALALMRSDPDAIKHDEWRLNGPIAGVCHFAAAETKVVRDWSISAEGTYLLTGGLGGVGLHLAQELAKAGAGTLVLTGRSEPSSETKDVVKKLRRSGTKVSIVAADVTDRSTMSALLDQLRNDDMPLRGVIHCAGRLADATILGLDQKTIDIACAAKVNGALLLDDMLQGFPLDHFVLTSSIATPLGSPGQAAYAAANGLLDALAKRRQARGDTALSLQLGPVVATGMLASGEVSVRDLAALGIHPLAANTLLDGMAKAWKNGAPVLALASFDAIAWTQQYPDQGNRARFSKLADLADMPVDTRKPNSNVTWGGDIDIRALSGPVRHAALVAEISTLIEAIERTPAESLDPDQPLRDMGLTSLSLVKLRQAIERRSGLTISIAHIFDHSTIRAFANYLSEQIDKTNVGSQNVESVAHPALEVSQARAALRAKLEKYR